MMDDDRPNGAFVGFSLDSDEFSRGWLRRAIAEILAQRSDLLFVLADRLLYFNKSVSVRSSNRLVLDLPVASRKIEQRKNDIRLFLASEIARLTKKDRSRISVASWDDFSDVKFANISRTLQIAYSATRRFRESVTSDVDAHFGRHPFGELPEQLYRDLCAHYVVEETAMIVRITEDGHPFEYYPQAHIRTLSDLYADKFAESGLTVEE
jgi:hypothetical protein